MIFQLTYGIHTKDLSGLLDLPYEKITNIDLNHEKVTHRFEIAHKPYTRYGNSPPPELEQRGCIERAQEYADQYILPLNPHEELQVEGWHDFAVMPEREYGAMREVILEGEFEIFQRHYIEIRWDDMKWGHWYQEKEALK